MNSSDKRTPHSGGTIGHAVRLIASPKSMSIDSSQGPPMLQTKSQQQRRRQRRHHRPLWKNSCRQKRDSLRHDTGVNSKQRQVSTGHNKFVSEPNQWDFKISSPKLEYVCAVKRNDDNFQHLLPTVLHPK